MTQIYNTLTKQKEPFTPPPGKRVNLFVCGPTVYGASHIGHARTYIFFDVMVKYLRSRGIDVYYLQNITDIDDKIIHRAKERNTDPLELARHETAVYKADMAAIKVTAVSAYAAASDHIEEIKTQIKKLIDAGHAYSSHGSVYYDISTFPDFGKLSHQNLETLQKAARTEDDRNKKHAHDFVLWRGREKDSGDTTSRGDHVSLREPVWDSPWGWGRPGWHIEDTAITEKYFGPQYDIHGGGIELVFPHHEAEIAQMEGISGKSPLAKIWMHTGWVTVKGEKMSKSLGNFITIQEILKKHSPEALRLLMLQTHYRSPLEYSEEQMQAAEKALFDLMHLKKHLELIRVKKSSDSTDNYWQHIQNALEDDCNTPKALGELFHAAGDIHASLTKGALGKESAVRFLELLKQIESIFGIIPPERPVPKEIKKMASDREKLRAEKKWDEADAIRKQIAEQGFIVDDVPEGTIILPV